MYPLLTPKQVVEILNCKLPTVYAWAKKGDIPAFRLNGIIRFDLYEIEDWISGQRMQGCDTLYKENAVQVKEDATAENLKRAVEHDG